MEALGAIYAAALIIGLAIIASVGAIGGLILLVAARGVRARGPEDPRPSRRAEVASGFAIALAVLASAATAIVSTAARTSLGPESIPSDTGLVAVLMLLLGLITIPAARLARHSAAWSATGGTLLLALLVPTAIQVWATSQTATFAERYRERQEAAAQREARYADLAHGPSVGAIVSAVGAIGPWTAVAGSMYPNLVYDEWSKNQGAVADLSGQTVRFAFFVQCWVEGDSGLATASVHDFDLGQRWSGSGGPCDGTMQLLVSDPIALPAWPAERLAQARSHDRDLVAAQSAAMTSAGTYPAGEYAIRSVVFISGDPTASVDALRAAVTAAAGSLEIR